MPNSLSSLPPLLSSAGGGLATTKISLKIDFLYTPSADIKFLIISDWSYSANQIEDLGSPRIRQLDDSRDVITKDQNGLQLFNCHLLRGCHHQAGVSPRQEEAQDVARRRHPAAAIPKKREKNPLLGHKKKREKNPFLGHKKNPFDRQR